jgi:hypothetical protein
MREGAGQPARWTAFIRNTVTAGVGGTDEQAGQSVAAAPVDALRRAGAPRAG